MTLSAARFNICPRQESYAPPNNNPEKKTDYSAPFLPQLVLVPQYSKAGKISTPDLRWLLEGHAGMWSF